MASYDVFLYAGDASPNNVILRDPTVAAGGGGSTAWTKNLSDSVTTSDSISKAITHLLSDTTALVETVLLTEGNFTDLITDHQTFTLHINDTATSSDIATSTSGFNKTIADSVTTSDSISNRPTKTLADTITSSDSISKAPIKAISDSITSSDVIVKNPAKYIADTITSSDILSRTVVYVKALSDTVTTSDVITPTGSGGPSFKYYYDVVTGQIINKSIGLVEGTIFRGLDGKEYLVINATTGLLERL